MQSLRSMSSLKLAVDGKKAGQVVHGLLSDDLKRLEGIWVDPGIGGLRFIDAERICSIGRGLLIAEDTGVHLRIRPKGLFIRAADADGNHIGAVMDAMIDETSLIVQCLMLAEGYFEYILHGSTAVKDFIYDRERRLVIISQ